MAACTGTRNPATADAGRGDRDRDRGCWGVGSGERDLGGVGRGDRERDRTAGGDGGVGSGERALARMVDALGYALATVWSGGMDINDEDLAGGRASGVRGSLRVVGDGLGVVDVEEGALLEEELKEDGELVGVEFKDDDEYWNGGISAGACGGRTAEGGVI